RYGGPYRACCNFAQLRQGQEEEGKTAGGTGREVGKDRRAHCETRGTRWSYAEYLYHHRPGTARDPRVLPKHGGDDATRTHRAQAASGPGEKGCPERCATRLAETGVC